MSEVNRVEMSDILSSLKPGINLNGVIDYADSFIFQGDSVHSYNNEIAVGHPLPEGLSLTGAVVAEPLLRFLSCVSAESVNFDTTEKELIVKTKNSKASFPLKIDKSFPVSCIPIPEKKGWKELSCQLVDALLLVAKSSSSVPTSILSFICIRKQLVIATDRFCLSAFMIPGLEDMPLLPSGIVSYFQEFKPTMFSFSKDWIHFFNEKESTLSCRCGEGEFPDVSSLLKITGQTILLPKDLSEVLKRAGLFSKTEIDFEKQLISLEAKEGQLFVKGTGWTGSFEETIPMEDDSEFSFSVHPDYIISAMELGRKMILNEKALLLKGKNFSHLISL